MGWFPIGHNPVLMADLITSIMPFVSRIFRMEKILLVPLNALLFVESHW
jgi:hypothetical protein